MNLMMSGLFLTEMWKQMNGETLHGTLSTGNLPYFRAVDFPLLFMK